jgi:REP element-mobilizing transposase RayT
MSKTFSQIYIHIVFGVKDRQALIPSELKDELYKYITGIIKHKGQKLLAINGTHDHIHLLISMNPDIAVSDLVREMKKHSTDFINGKGLLCGKFYWQEGYGAFSYSNSQIPVIIKYIQDQEKHHSVKTFHEEFIKILDEFQITYNKEYLFK